TEAVRLNDEHLTHYRCSRSEFGHRVRKLDRALLPEAERINAILTSSVRAHHVDRVLWLIEYGQTVVDEENTPASSSMSLFLHSTMSLERTRAKTRCVTTRVG